METTQATDLTIPNVRIEGTLGRGGFGVVHRGRHLGLDVEVAVKVLDAEAGDPSAIERALAEARLMARLDHPNVLRIHDAGRAGSAIYLVLEIMDGGNCSALRRVSPARGLELARQLLAGIQALHEARIIHRDIKPANCLLRIRDGRVKLADLGIAVEQLTREAFPEETAGTLPFMAPELFEHPPRFGVASDLYALGMTLACLFLDENPYPSGPIPHLMGWIRAGERPRISARRPDMPHELTSLVDRLLAREAGHRPSSASEALASLGRASLPAAPHAAGRESPPAAAIGPWVHGALILDDGVWETYAVSHARTGAPGRLVHLKSSGPIRDSSELVLASADRASRLDHPSILDLVDWGLEDDRAYVVTLPQGRTFRSLVESGGPIDETDAVGFAGAIAEALAYLHHRGLVYQIVDATTAAVSPDARTAQLGSPMFCRAAGSPAMDPDGRSQRAFVPQTAAPEVFNFDIEATIETPSDLYGLGDILYYLLAGTEVFPPSPLFELLKAKDSTPCDVRERNPMVTAPTARLVASLLDPDPARRPTASAAVEELGLIARRLRKLRPVGDPA